MAETLRLVQYELERTLTLPRVALALCLLYAATQSATGMMGSVSMQLYANSASDASVSLTLLPGATAFDIFYMVMNLTASSLLPMACIVLCGDLISRDAGNDGRLLIATRLNRRSSYAKAKMLTACILCFGCVIALFLISFAVGTIQLHLPLGDGSVPSWLTTKGPEYTTWQAWGSIPETWSYAAVLAGLVLSFGIIETAIVFVTLALSVRCRTRLAPIVMGCLVVVLLNALGNMGTSIAVALDASAGRSFVGWIADRFSLGYYRLGAGFFQTEAGQLAGQVLSTAEGPVYFDNTFPINSFAQLTVIVGTMIAASCATLSVTLRNAGLPNFKRRKLHAKG